MEVAVFQNLTEAMKSLMIEDDEYILVMHTLKAGEEIKMHYHPKATEWLIIGAGIFEVTIEKEKKIFDSSELLAHNMRVFLFPRGEKHMLVAITPIKYFVLRNKKDKTIYVKGGSNDEN